MAFTYFLGDGCFSFFSSSDSASDEDDDVVSDSLSDSEDSDSSEELLEDSDSEPLLDTVKQKKHPIIVYYPTGRKFSLEFKFRYCTNGKFAIFKIRLLVYF